MPLVTRESVAEKLEAYLRHDLSLAALVDWAESALMKKDSIQRTSRPSVMPLPESAQQMCAHSGSHGKIASNSFHSSVIPLKSTSSPSNNVARLLAFFDRRFKP
ncbi:MAG TPA: hypothetical protein VJ746_10430 [Nitrospira sp.]|nr:hypothetical protein [Nitrospira sp.]